MTYYFCISTGLADYTPNDQQYHACETIAEMQEILAAACDQWVSDLPKANAMRGDEFYCHEFRIPREGEDNYSQRLLIAASTDEVLDVTGMTADDYARESEGE